MCVYIKLNVIEFYNIFNKNLSIIIIILTIIVFLLLWILVLTHLKIPLTQALTHIIT